MEDEHIAAYLAAAAWADGPISDSERALVENLLFNLGLERGEAAELLKQWEFKAPTPPDLSTLTDRAQGIALLRALLVVSYSDGHFGMEELPYLTKVLDKFKVSSEELMQLRLQAQYYLDPEAPNIEVTMDLVQAERWPEVEAQAREERARLRAALEHKMREELMSASLDSLLVMLYRGRSFDVEEARTEFEKRRGDLIERHGAMHDDGLLRAQIMLATLARWDRLYADGCRSCGLAAPGRKGSLCPSCSEDYQ
jgi:uncharacterized tellurite resistance protein B-like protein